MIVCIRIEDKFAKKVVETLEPFEEMSSLV